MPVGKYIRTKEFRKEIGERTRKLKLMDSPVTRKKISDSLKGKFVGEENPNYKNGLGMKGQRNVIRFKAKIRDNWTCQVCGLREPEIMEVDHIKPKSRFPELKNALENQVTLCPNCHKRKTVRDRKAYNW